MKNKLSIGIDVSKLSLDVAMTSDGKTLTDITKVMNNEEGYNQIRVNIEKLSKDKTAHICMESTGIYSVGCRNYLQEKGYIVSELNPKIVSSFRVSSMVRIKTDRADAKVLALYGYKMSPRASVRDSKEEGDLKSYSSRLGHLVRKLASSKTYIGSLLDEGLIESEKRIMATLELEIKYTESLIQRLIESNETFKNDHDLLISIPGIATKTAVVVMSGLISEANLKNQRYSKRCQSAHAGLAPSQYQSGISIKPR